jgi:hypothetical protein
VRFDVSLPLVRQMLVSAVVALQAHVPRVDGGTGCIWEPVDPTDSAPVSAPRLKAMRVHRLRAQDPRLVLPGDGVGGAAHGLQLRLAGERHGVYEHCMRCASRRRRSRQLARRLCNAAGIRVASWWCGSSSKRRSTAPQTTGSGLYYQRGATAVLVLARHDGGTTRGSDASRSSVH